MEYGAEITIKKTIITGTLKLIHQLIVIYKKKYTYTHMCFYILGGYCKYLDILVWLVHLKQQKKLKNNNK